MPLPDLKGQYIVQFSDITSDMFTDIITVDKTGKIIIIHVFDSMSSNYSQKVSFAPDGCETISNVAVGRGSNTLRLFVTCMTTDHKNVIKIYDRNLNDELLENVSSNKTNSFTTKSDKSDSTGANATNGNGTRSFSDKDFIDRMKEQSDNIMKNLMGGYNMVYKSNNIRSLTFMETKDIFYLYKESQPFIGDLNGDMIDDIIFNNAENN